MSHSSVNPSGRVYILERDEISAAGQQNWFVWRATAVSASPVLQFALGVRPRFLMFNR
jgi:hypothetical protein